MCTASSPTHFSYRRDGLTGRLATIVVLPSNAHE
jgi:copper oxidase (laccase) domain-containing protein